MNPFSVSFFSDPPVATWIVPQLLNSGVPVSSIVSILPTITKLDFPVAIQEAANSRGIPFFRPNSLSDEGFLRSLSDTKPAVIACMSFLRKIPPAVLRIPKLGGINCHPSLLPKYRGSFPYFWTILNGDKEAGVTIHEITQDFDAGDVHFSDSFPVDSAETAGTLMIKSAGVGIRLLVQALNELQTGRPLLRTPQNPALATFARFPDPGLLEIRWDQNAERILTLIRAASPFIGAFTSFRNVPLKIWSARLSRPNAHTKPGTIVVSRGKTEVAALDYFLELEVMQLEMMRFYSGRGFASEGIRDGEILGHSQ